MKKVIAVVLVAVMTLVAWNGVLCDIVTVKANEYRGTCGANGDNLMWILDEDGVLTILGNGEMANYYKDNGGPWKEYQGIIKKLRLETGVTSVGSKAFYGCTGLTGVEISESVASIGDSAFYNCIGLTNIEIPESVTSIAYAAFENCIGLTSVKIPESVTSIGRNIFANCSNLASLEISESVANIGACAFQGCIGLTSLTIPEGVGDIGAYAFQGCTSLTSLTIPEGVEDIGAYAFQGCTGLTSLTIPETVMNIETYAFDSCVGLTSIMIPGSVTHIKAEAFRNCNNLKNIIILSDQCVIEYGRGTIPSTAVIVCNENSRAYEYAIRHNQETEWLSTEYQIICHLVGGRMNGECPSTYKVTDDTVTLANPEKNGYAFEGWTGTDLKEVTKTVTIPKGSLGDRTYTAHWTKIAVSAIEGRFTEFENTTLPKETTTLTRSDNTTLSNEATTVPLRIATVKIKKILAKKRSARKAVIKIKTVKNANGYQINFYTKKEQAKKNKKALLKKTIMKNKAKFTIKHKKLKNKNNLFVRVRAIVTLQGKRFYGAWSKAKKIKVKK